MEEQYCLNGFLFQGDSGGPLVYHDRLMGVTTANDAKDRNRAYYVDLRHGVVRRFIRKYFYHGLCKLF